MDDSAYYPRSRVQQGRLRKIMLNQVAMLNQLLLLAAPSDCAATVERLEAARSTGNVDLIAGAIGAAVGVVDGALESDK